MNNEIDLMQYDLSLFVRCLGQLMTNDCCCDFTDLTNADDRSGMVRSGMDVMVNAEVEMWKRGCCDVVEMR